MPRLIYEGDTISNFGRFLPAPYVSKIIATEKEDQITITIQSSLFLRVTEGFEPREDLEELFNTLDYYNIVCTDIEIYESLLSNKLNLIDLLVNIDVEDEETLQFHNGTLNQENIIFTDAGYDAKDNKIVEVSGYETSFIFENDIDDMYVFVFTGYDYETISLERPRLAAKYFSDLSYEKIYNSGVLMTDLEPAFVDANEAPYDALPLQDVVGKYFKSEPVTLDDIIDSFQALIDVHETTDTTDSNLESAVTNISYILSTSENTPDILPRLNELRRVFPSKTSADATGRLYNAFKKKLATTNTAVKNNGSLTKKLVFNSKITTGAPDLTAQFSVYGGFDLDAVDTNYIYPQVQMSRQAFGLAGYDQFEYGNARRNSGFFFFDYEKAVHQQSNIGKFLDINKIESMFGKNILNNSYRLEQVQFRRLRTFEQEEGGEVTKTEMKMITRYPEGADYQSWTGSGSYGTIEFYDNSPAYGFASLTQWGTGEDVDPVEYSNCIQRNLSLTNAEGLGGYRLICYEFNDLYPEARAGTGIKSWYETKVDIADDTLNVAALIISSYISAAEDFIENYYTPAMEGCGANATLDTFNPFFAEGVTDKYSDTLSSAPWVRMPLIFNMHLDLLTNKFNGDKNTIIKNAEMMSTLMSPFMGTVTSLENFKTLIEDFQSTYYEQNGTVNPAMYINKDMGTERSWTTNFEDIQLDATVFYEDSYDEDFTDTGIDDEARAEALYQFNTINGAMTDYTEDIYQYFINEGGDEAAKDVWDYVARPAVTINLEAASLGADATMLGSRYYFGSAEYLFQDTANDSASRKRRQLAAGVLQQSVYMWESEITNSEYGLYTRDEFSSLINDFMTAYYGSPYWAAFLPQEYTGDTYYLWKLIEQVADKKKWNDERVKLASVILDILLKLKEAGIFPDLSTNYNLDLVVP